jgi:subtilisin family serine protease
VVPGKNYIVPGTDASEWTDYTLNQSQEFAFALNQSQEFAFALNQSQEFAFALDQSQEFAFVLNQSQEFAFALDGMPRAFGHGTMVAGLVHLVAPDALIMPMKAFDATGATTLWNVVRAIYDSVAYGADVINLSFSSPTNSRMLDAAINYARAKGVSVVASAGNDNSDAPTFPASLQHTVAVTSLNPDDTKASFANYGKYVGVSGPGVGLITAFPGGLYALVAGTSFTSPLVVGEFALLHEVGVSGDAARDRIEKTAQKIDALNTGYQDELGKGKIDIVKALNDE